MERLKKIGEIKAITSLEVKTSKVGLGFEKLDRDSFDPEKAYDKAAALGVKWIRIQSGWAKTEKIKGIYDFAWLDSIVDNLLRRGMVPWMCLCYGNPLYTPLAREVYGAVGCPPIATAEEREAWHKYVAACTAHYKGRVQWYEVWNEPDGMGFWKTGPNGTEYGELVKATAAAIKEGDPEAKVICGSTCTGNNGWLNDVFQTGAAAVSDALTYHAYNFDEASSMDRVRSLFALCKFYNPKMRLIQGETGTQSNWLSTAGALNGGAWSPERQAKFLIRHFVSDFMFDILFASYFSCLDMKEAFNGKAEDLSTTKDYGYFGLLGATFDENGNATGEYKPKPSYYAMQNIASLFADDFERCDLPIQIQNGNSPRTFSLEPAGKELMLQGFSKPNGSFAYAYWNSTNLMHTTYDGTVSFQITALPGPMRLIDPLTGSVYEFPENMIEKNEINSFHLKHAPVKDYPLLLTFGEFARIK